MQTFLPYYGYRASARVLDRQRLGKQRVEAKQILLALTENPTSSWKNHPAVKMWKGHEASLCLYGAMVCLEWRNRGYQDSLMPFFSDFFLLHYGHVPKDGVPKPVWLNKEFCLSHQSNLIRKFPEYYTPIFGSSIPNDLPYVWPV